MSVFGISWLKNCCVDPDIINNDPGLSIISLFICCCAGFSFKLFILSGLYNTRFILNNLGEPKERHAIVLFSPNTAISSL